MQLLEIPAEFHELAKRVLREAAESPPEFDADVLNKRLWEEGAIHEFHDHERRKAERVILVVPGLPGELRALLAEANETYFHGLYPLICFLRRRRPLLTRFGSGETRRCTVSRPISRKRRHGAFSHLRADWSSCWSTEVDWWKATPAPKRARAVARTRTRVAEGQRFRSVDMMERRDILARLRALVALPELEKGFKSQRDCLDWANKVAPLLTFNPQYHGNFLSAAHTLNFPVSTQTTQPAFSIMRNQMQMAIEELSAEEESSISTVSDMTKIFVSHSGNDLSLAELVVSLMGSALTLPAREILCTSVEGHRLPAGADTDERFRSRLSSLPPTRRSSTR